MAEELLDEADVSSAFQHVGCAGVTQKVTASAAAEVSFFDKFAHHAAENIGDYGAMTMVPDTTEAGIDLILLPAMITARFGFVETGKITS